MCKLTNKLSTLVVKLDRRNAFLLFGIILFYFTGCILMLIIKNEIYYKYDEFVEQDVVINAFVCNEAEVKADKIEFIIKTDNICTNDYVRTGNSLNYNISGRILVKVYYKDLNTLEELISNAKELPKYGQGVMINSTIKLPRSMTNPKSFDYRKYLAGRKVSAYISVAPKDIQLTNKIKSNFFIRLGYVIKSRIVTVIEKTMPEQQASLLNGMLIGYRDSMEEIVQTAFSDAGLTHIMAVSGANIAFIVLPLLFVFKKFRLSRLKSNIIVILFVMLFVFTTGLDASVLRAAAMAIIILVGRTMMRETDVFTSIAFSAIILLFINPFYIFNIGFLLSYGATLGLVLLYAPMKKLICWRYLPEVVRDTIACTLAAQLGVLPITVYFFNKISLVSVLSNLLVVPLTGAVTIIGFISAGVGQIWMVGAQVVAYVNCTLISFILWVVKVSAKLPYATISVITPSLVVIAVYYLIIALILLYIRKSIVKKSFLRYTGILVGIIVICIIKNIFPGELKVVFADVGQGDSIIIKTHYGKTVLIDGGGRMNWGKESNEDIGTRTVLPLLLDMGISSLDAVVCTHAHYDHIGGIYSVLEHYKARELFLRTNLSLADGINSTHGTILEKYDPYFKLKSIAKKKGVNISYIDSRKKIWLDKKTYIEVLNPCYEDSEAYNENSKSLVFRLVYKNTEILFCGDIEKDIENRLLESGEEISADVIKIAHHGADTSSQIAFLKRVDPKAAVISVGKTNNFGHPAKAVLENLESIKCEVYRTDIQGAITITSNGNKIKLKAEVD